MTRLEQRERNRQQQRHHLVKFGQFSWRTGADVITRRWRPATGQSEYNYNPRRNRSSLFSSSEYPSTPTTTTTYKRRSLEWKASRRNFSPPQFHVPLPASVSTRNEAERLYQTHATTSSSGSAALSTTTTTTTTNPTFWIPLDKYTTYAMRLVVIDRIIDASPGHPCTMMDILTALKGSSFVFDMYSHAKTTTTTGSRYDSYPNEATQTTPRAGWFSEALGWMKQSMTNRRSSSVDDYDDYDSLVSTKKYELMKTLELLEQSPTASVAQIASWEDAQRELSTYMQFPNLSTLRHDDDNVDEEEETAAQILAQQAAADGEEEVTAAPNDVSSGRSRNNPMMRYVDSSTLRYRKWLQRYQREGQRSRYARRPLIQKLAQLVHTTTLPLLFLHSETVEDEQEQEDPNHIPTTKQQQQQPTKDGYDNEDVEEEDVTAQDKIRNYLLESNEKTTDTLLHRLDIADRTFVIYFLQKERLLQQQVRPSVAVRETAQKLLEQERLEQELQEQERKQQEEAERRAQDLMRPLTAEEQERVHDMLYNPHGPSSETVIAQIDADSVQRGSFQRLAPGQWLNDEVIHFFLTVLGRRDEQLCAQNTDRRRSHFFKSFFMSKLLNEGNANPAINGKYEYKNVKRWSKKVPGKDIFQLDKVLFPINEGGMHWVSAVAFIQEKRIQFYDSMGSSGMHYLRHIFQYLQDEHVDKKKCPLPDVDEWKLVPCDVENTPRQLNGYDCGVFTCMFIDFVSKDCPLVFQQSHITQCRERIALSILNGTAIL